MFDNHQTAGRPEQSPNHAIPSGANPEAGFYMPLGDADIPAGAPDDDMANPQAQQCDEQALERRLLADGANWRARSPSVRGVSARLGEQISLLTQVNAARQGLEWVNQAQPDASSPALFPPDIAHDEAHDAPGLLTTFTASTAPNTRTLPPRPFHARRSTYPQHPTRGGYRMPKGRLRGFAAAAIMVLLIALFATLVFTMLPKRGGTAHTTRPTGATMAPDGKWKPVDTLTEQTAVNAANSPAIAPSDPNVVYETMNGQDSQGYQTPGVRRTTNGGKTWQTVALPSTVNQTAVNAIMVFVSPLDPQVVFLGLSDESATSCAAGNSANGYAKSATPLSASVNSIGASPNTHASGYGWCTEEFRSVNGGATWAPLTFSQPGALTSGGLNPPAMVAQGYLIYSTLGCVSSYCSRLVVSADGGATWRPVDAAIHSAGQTVCDFAAGPDSQTVFADSVAGSGANCGGTFDGSKATYTLWRSDDAGASWSVVGALPRNSEHSMLLVSRGPGQTPLLYIDMPTVTDYSTDKMGDKVPILSLAATDLGVSADGGKTWSYAPAAGAPTDLVVSYGPMGALSDGSVIMPFIGKDWQTSMTPLPVTLYAWKVGQSAWSQLTPPTPAENVAGFVVEPSSAGKGHDTLWLVMSTPAYTPDSRDAYYVYRDQL